MKQEPCPAHLDDDGREIWKQCRWIIEGGNVAREVPLTLQALWICRELRQESRANQIQAELDALRFQVVELAGKCGMMLSPSATGEAMASIEITIKNLRHERALLITVCKESADQIRRGRTLETASDLLEAVRIATGN